ncbi:GAF domain-containing protein [Aggregatimonas sangjinii]|uniref:GAF domain-containing protein n=1 Tax=Aggregatimonas sangjinii TaxID=2583587 RepID=A0A5B7SPX1_9FLAO|nr:GAF domain-containing protein [Aggregatimonas sangjinii]QCW99448.1 GAF domain-containing protein [Aggregatimonas sangjinii]
MEKKKEKNQDQNEILYSILNDITSVQSIPELLQTIFLKVNKVIDFDDVGLFHVLEDGRHRDLTSASELSFGANKTINQHLGDIWLAPEKSMKAASEKLRTETVDEFFKKYPKHPHTEYINSEGLKQFISIPLIRNSKTFGVFLLWSKKESTYSKRDIPLFTKIADMITVTLSNILDREEILRQNAINQHLLSISEATAAVSDFKQLFDIINKKVKLLFPFDDSGLFHVLPDGRHRDFMVDFVGNEDISISLKSNSIEGYMKPESSIIDALKGTLLYDGQEFLKRIKDHPHFQELEEAGVKQVISTPLIISGKPIGVFNLISLEPNVYFEQDFPLFQSLADLIALALNNLIVKDELIAEKTFKETLLGISEAVTNIRERNDLYNTIMNLIQPIIQFDEAALITIDSDRQTFKHILSMASKPAQKNKLYPAVMETEFDIKRSPAEQIVNGDDINYFELSKWLQDYPDFPGLHLMADLDLHHTTSLKLKNQGELIAFINFHFKEPQNLHHPKNKLYPNIADQLSVAVSNILANEQLLNEKNFKQTLLGISESVNSIRNREDLYNSIMTDLLPIVNFSDAVLCLVDTTTNKHHHPLTMSPKSTTDHPLYKEVVENQVDTKGTPIEKVLEGDDVAHFVLSDWLKVYPKYPGLLLMKDIGLEHSITLLLKHQEVSIGILFFHFKTEQILDGYRLRLFDSIRSQFSVALSNILAQESLDKEKNFKETLLNISEVISTVQSGNKLLRVIFDKIRPIFNFYDTGLFVFNEDKTALEDWSLKYNALALSPESKEALADVEVNKPLSIEKGSNMAWELALLRKANGPIIIDLTDMAKQFPQYEQSKYLVEANYHDSMQVLLKYAGNTLGFFCINAKKRGFFTQSQLPLFQAIADQLAVAVSNILDNQTLVSEKQFKETLLGISEAMATILDRKELLATIVNYLKPIITVDDLGVVVYNEEKTHWRDLTVSEEYLELSNVSNALYEHNMDKWIPFCSLTKRMQKTPLRIWTIEEFLSHKDFAFREILANENQKQFITAPLKSGNEIIGVLVLVSLERAIYTDAQLPLMQQLTDQVGPAVDKILSTEKLIAEKNFKETLLRISESIATIQNWRELFKVFFEVIAPIFPSDSPGLMIIDGDSHYEILDEEILKEKSTLYIWKSAGRGPFKNKNTPVEHSIKDAGPHLILIKDMVHPHKASMLKMGLKQEIYGALKYGGKTIGVLCFNSRKEDEYSESDFTLFQALSDQLAVAVANVLANEALLEEKNFKETLLNISEAVTTIRNRSELFKILFEKVQPIVPFECPGLFIIDGDHHYEVIDEGVTNDMHSIQVWNKIGTGPFANKESFVQEVLNDPKVYTSPIENVKHPHIATMLKTGLRHMIYGPLKNRGEIIGVFILNSTNENEYNNTDPQFFQAIADQFAVATSNILSKEALLEEKNFKETLLAISEAVASIQDRQELFRVIFEKIKPVIPIDDVGIVLLNEDKNQFADLAVTDNYNLTDSNVELANKGLSGYMDIDTLVAYMLESTEISSIDTLIEKFPDNAFMPIMKSQGFKEMMFTPLKVGNSIIGALAFDSFKENAYSENQLPLFQAIADQLAVAVNNVLANEALLQEKNFSHTLLRITEAVAQVKNSSGLYRTIFDHIKPIFPYDELGLFIYNAKEDIHYELITADDLQKSDAQKLVETNLGQHTRFKHTGSSVEWVMNNGPISIDIVELDKKSPHPQHQYMLEGGLQNVIGGPLVHGGESIGLLCFNHSQAGYYQEEHLVLFKSIAEQVSIAVSNILANEKILEREREKATLLEITSAVSKIRNLPDFLSFVTTKLKPIFNFVDVGIFLLTDDGKYHYDMAGFNDKISSSPINSALLASGNESILHKDSLIDWMMLQIEKENGPVLFDFKLLVRDFPDYYQFTLVDMPNSGYRDCLAANLKIGDSVFGMFCINALQKDFFKKEQFSLFQNVTEQLSVAISNILANQQTEEEKKYSENLLEITEALAATTNAVELYNAIDTVVKKIIPFDQVGVLILDKSESYHYELINEKFVNQVEDQNRKGATVEKQTLYKHQGSSVEWLANNGPVITSMDFLVENTEHPRHIDMVNAGVKELLGGPLVNQGKKIGMMAFKLKKEGVFNEQHIKHYKSVSEQVSICVANILSKKEILWKSAIQDLELKISNILTTEQKSNDKWDDIFQEYKALIPFTFATVIKVTKDRLNDFTYEWITPVEKRQLSLKNIEEITKLSTTEITKAQKGLIQLSKKENEVIQLKDIPKATKGYMDALGLQSVLPHRLHLKKKHTEVYFFMFSKDKNHYSIRHCNILEGVRNTLRISLENLFSSFSIKEMSEQLQLEKTYLESVVKETYNFEHMIGESKAMRDVFAQVSEVAAVDATALILGETGTGKELIARAIHENSTRKDRVLVKVNCAAIPSQIVESELFGHQRGAFTGAVKDRIGKFELANKGTIFLDEIGEMPLELQTKLLRVIQEREVERLGSNVTIPLDIRIIAATNRNLNEEITTGIFRSDLFYRLNGYPIQVPPLRARGEDVLLLADFFARQFSEQYGLPFKGFTANTLKRFQAYDWPGNVRELQNNIEQAIISQKGKIIEIHPGNSNVADFEWMASEGTNTRALKLTDDFDMDAIKREKDLLERNYLLEVLEKKKWKVSGKNGAARQLGVAPSTLESRMRKLGISRS